MAWDLLLSGGYAGLNVDEVAERAAVAKTTLYRRWPTKQALVADVLFERAAHTVLGPGGGSQALSAKGARQVGQLVYLAAAPAGAARRLDAFNNPARFGHAAVSRKLPLAPFFAAGALLALVA